MVARHDYMPFGEKIFTAQRTGALGYTADTVRQKFTGYERDSESGLDFAQARYYSSKHGRFMSVDPLASSANPLSPKTWNRYAYVLNNPLKLVDPSGLSSTPAPLPRDLDLHTFEAESTSNDEPGDYYNREGNWIGIDGL